MVKERRVNKKNEKMIHDRQAESEKVEQWGRWRDGVRGLEEVSGGERRLPEKLKQRWEKSQRKAVKKSETDNLNE